MQDHDLSIEQANPPASQLEGVVPESLEMIEETAKPEQSVYVASQWKLMWWKFRRHKMAMAGLVIVIFFISSPSSRK